MFVKHRFELANRTCNMLQSMVPKFGYNGFGEIVFYRTYSRIRYDGGQESWADCVERVTNGTFSIRKDFYLKNYIPWEEEKWQYYARDFAISMFQMKWLPPGRGLWAMGSNFVYERGAMALYNCAYTNLTKDFADDISWLMDTLMHGVGVGFGPLRDDLELYEPMRYGKYDFIIPDTREGWCEVVSRIILAYMTGDRLPYPIFDRVRQAGLPIKGFGGVSSGPEPLQKLLQEIICQCELVLESSVDIVEFKTNIANLVGTCVVAGNVRRSAEIACGSVHDKVFMDLKNYKKNPHRAGYGWMSNNTVFLETTDDFDHLGQVATRVIHDGEPGVANRKTMRHGRIGKFDNVRIDQAVGFNPCGEIPLEHREVCNLSETLPTMCDGVDDWYTACNFATFYSSTVALLPTHQTSTNRVVARNRRIGVGIIDYTGWKHEHGVHKITKYLRSGYEIIRETNKALNAEAGVPEAIRVTCIKPGGTTPKLAGKTSGCGHPTFHYTLRRIRVAQNSPIHSVLVEAGIPYEKDFVSALTDVFEFPILQGPAKAAQNVSLWEQANNLVLLQREWADNAVSNTLYFKPKWTLIEIGGFDLLTHYVGKSRAEAYVKEKKEEILIKEQTKFVLTHTPSFTVKMYEYNENHEEGDIEAVLSSIMPLCKSVSLLPHTNLGVYKQMPEEGISEEEYTERLSRISSIDWSNYKGSDGQDEIYCQGDKCEILLPS